MSNNEVKYSITGGSLATTNHAHYDSFRIRSTLVHMSINVNVNMKRFDLFRKKIVRKDNLKVAERRRTVSSVSILFL